MENVKKVSEHLLAINKLFYNMTQEESEAVINELYKHKIDVFTLKHIGSVLQDISQ
ncbi:hypothetical protein [Lederbergia lenta]|uniref:hypothetical protein n=1 Tax=Lederbergia lenta TaxID=1467 RepID=UPI002040D14D|nr:hypothetical protein [Lederbergia lenta]MCM3109994.1 hypothetical protein [Lederbergia lenta]